MRRLLDAGATVAIVTDAGTPGISDPGERLVRAAIEGGHEVVGVPGPAAAIAALVVSGLPTQRFVMEGFLPRSGRERSDRLAGLAGERRTIVLYEAPHRLARTLADLARTLGDDRAVAVARELTKLHEETWRGTLGRGRRSQPRRLAPRGEHVLVVAGAPRRPRRPTMRSGRAGRPSGRRRRSQDGHRSSRRKPSACRGGGCTSWPTSAPRRTAPGRCRR